MTPVLERLLKASMGPLALPVNENTELSLLDAWGSIGQELRTLLEAKDGLYAFESALLIRPVNEAPPLASIKQWNEPARWRDRYGDLSSFLFFAEDIFGNQFAIHDASIVSFDSETGETEELATTLEEWVTMLFEDASFHTGWPLAHQWQEERGALPLGIRLLPKQPFVLGGDYVIDNLVPAKDVDGMRARGNLATQLRTLPEGSTVKYELKSEQP